MFTDGAAFVNEPEKLLFLQSLSKLSGKTLTTLVVYIQCLF